MLQIKNITKIYRTEEVEQKALDGVSVNLRNNEFVSILGPSGSGKTTLLNIIGGIDQYTSGDLIIDGVSTKNYKSQDWDAYRNHSIGFVFQSYNLISHQTILSNVELALTLSGISGSERKRRAKEALEKVGLKDHINKKPSQLSGGQMQRVAIARALVNNPEIVLADEPTGALDSKTSVQIMELLKEIAKDKLVVMVTHNPDLAKKYSTRIISVKDGKIIDDTKPFDGKDEKVEAKKRKYTPLSLKTALTLSLNNLMTKRGRTFLTAIAGSIGIIGIAVILALASGLNSRVSDLTSKSSTPSAISVQETYTGDDLSLSTKTEEKPNHENALLAVDDLSSNFDISKTKSLKHNDTKALKKYIEGNRTKIEKNLETIQYLYDGSLQIFEQEADGTISRVSPVEQVSTVVTDAGNSLDNLFEDKSKKIEISQVLKTAFAEITSSKPFEILSGQLPKNEDELLLVVDKDGEIPLTTMYSLGIADRVKLASALDKLNTEGDAEFKSEVFSYDKVIGKTYRVAKTVKSIEEENYKEIYNDGIEVKVVGVAKVKGDADGSGYMGYLPALTEKVFPDEIKTTPLKINLFPKSEDDKKSIKEFLDNYNKQTDKKVKYVDQTEAMIEAIKSLINAISFVLIGFVAISLVVSSIMIGIITYISVLERTKEIGILRAIGASKRDVVRVFRAETIIEGLAAGVFGVLISWIICFGINALVSLLAHIDNIADLSPLHAVILIAISVALTVFAGSAPASRASKKDPVEALRSE